MFTRCKQPLVLLVLLGNQKHGQNRFAHPFFITPFTFFMNGVRLNRLQLHVDPNSNIRLVGWENFLSIDSTHCCGKSNCYSTALRDRVRPPGGGCDCETDSSRMQKTGEWVLPCTALWQSNFCWPGKFAWPQVVFFRTQWTVRFFYFVQFYLVFLYHKTHFFVIPKVTVTDIKRIRICQLLSLVAP